MSYKDISLEELKKNPLVLSKEYVEKSSPFRKILIETAVEMGYMKIAEDEPQNTITIEKKKSR